MEQPTPNLFSYHAQLWVSRVLIATSFPVGAAITHGLDPAVLTLVRFALAAALFAPIVGFRYGLKIPDAKSLTGYAIIGLCLAIFFWGMFEALLTTTPLNTSAMFALVPGIAAIFGIFLVREHLNRYQMAALAVGLIGALWIVFRGDINLALSLTLVRGDWIFFGACIVMALYMPLVKKFHRGEPTTVMTFWVLLTGTAWLALFTNTKIWTTDWTAIEGTVWLGIVYLAVVTTMFSFFIQQKVVIVLGATRVTATNYANPGLVVAIEWLTGRGFPPLIVLPGVIIVVAAMVVLQRGVANENEDLTAGPGRGT
jgi:drug/metabolite transporter (DMT)-like permease